MRFVTALALSSLVLLACSIALAGDSFITDYYGFSWETTPGGPYVPWQAGNTYEMVGTIDALQPPLTFDFSLNEYSFVILHGVQDGDKVLVGSGVDPHKGPYSDYQINYVDGASFDVYEDPSKNSYYQPDPPNASVPSTFVDGTLYLGATASYWYSIIRKYTNSGDELGSFECNLLFTGGSHLSELNCPPGNCTGYSFAGITANPHASIPHGYKERIDGQQFYTPVVSTTWGGIKSLYGR